MDTRLFNMRKMVFWVGFFTFLCFLSHDYHALEMKKLDAPKQDAPSIFENLYPLPELDLTPWILPESPLKLDPHDKNSA